MTRSPDRRSTRVVVPAWRTSRTI